jgi:hypothetical protein
MVATARPRRPRTPFRRNARRPRRFRRAKSGRLSSHGLPPYAGRECALRLAISDLPTALCSLGRVLMTPPESPRLPAEVLPESHTVPSSIACARRVRTASSAAAPSAPEHSRTRGIHFGACTFTRRRRPEEALHCGPSVAEIYYPVRQTRHPMGDELSLLDRRYLETVEARSADGVAPGRTSKSRVRLPRGHFEHTSAPGTPGGTRPVAPTAARPADACSNSHIGDISAAHSRARTRASSCGTAPRPGGREVPSPASAGLTAPIPNSRLHLTSVWRVHDLRSEARRECRGRAYDDPTRVHRAACQASAYDLWHGLSRPTSRSS